MIIHSHGKRLFENMLDMADTAFSYRRALIVSQFIQESSKVKESCLLKSEMKILRFYLAGQNVTKLRI